MGGGTFLATGAAQLFSTYCAAYSATSGQRRPCHGELKDPEDMWVKLKRRLFAEAQISKDQGSMIWRGSAYLPLYP